MNRARIVGVCAGIGWLAAGILHTAAPAQADTGNEQAYLSAMYNSGFTVYDVGRTIASGYWICNRFDIGEDGNAVSRDLFANSTWSDVPNLHAAQVWVDNAANTLCPWVWNRPTVPSLYA